MRILVVDDDTLNRFLLLHLLEQQGYVDCYEAENGFEALSLASRIKPDLILLDTVMPVMDGYELAPKLKQMAGDIYLPIIFISTLDDDASLARCLEVGGDDFVTKPFDKTLLAAKIRAHARTRLLSKKASEQNKQLSFYRNAVEREHKIVEHIFANALTVEPELRKIIDFELKPAGDFNGDMFLTHASPTGGLYFLIGDFTGHGLAAAIGALPVSKAFQTMSRKGLSLMEMAETINTTLLQLLPDEMFFAAILVEINHSGRQIDVWNGGMPNLLLQNSEGKIVKRFISQHMALGILDANEFEADVERFEAQYGDRLIGFSDGVVEVENEQGKMLADSGVERWLETEPNCDVPTLLAKLEKYTGGIERKDDVTLVIYTCQTLTQVDRFSHASQLPIKLGLELDHHLIKSSEPIIELINMLTSQLSLYGVHSQIYTVVNELYNNAVDHGLLLLNSALKKTDEGFFEYFTLRQQKLAALDHGKINISIQYQPQERLLDIEVSDSGRGFDPDTFANNLELEKSYGRGLPLVKELCCSMKHSNHGSTVSVVFKI
ncbi:fused response regulator/phosphatase [Paraglaciecola sp.]|uniref:ATP-binding SpoIIE family protein phosphatase n=1 Tax=Paraglaciecola sp. TaxID=1920173 RepID=UPI0030F3F68D